MSDRVHKRDAGVELMRILGCLIVLGCHNYLPIYIDGVADTSRTLVGMFCADGVAIFWLILGFFLFQQDNYEKQWRRTCSHILIPMLVFSIFSFYVFPYVCGDVPTLKESICRPREEYMVVIRAFVSWGPPYYYYVGHLWYLYIYVLLILIFPALFGVVQAMEKSEKLKTAFLIGIAVILIDNVLTNNDLMAFSHHTIGGLVPASMIAVFGHFVYKRRSLMERYGLLAPFCFIALNAVRTFLYLRGYDTIIYWYTFSGVIGAICVAAFSMSLMARMKNEKIKSGILKLSSYTFPIYLLQYFTVAVLSRLHFQDRLLNKLSPLPHYLIDILYTAIMAILVFCISLLISVPNRYIGYLFKKLRSTME